MAKRLGIGTGRLEEWLRSLGCTKGTCPNEFTCVWHPPGALPPFLVPNPARYPYIPFKQKTHLADIVSEILGALGLGSSMP